MSPTELEKKIKEKLDTKKLEIELFKYLKSNPEKILFYQRQQLFKKSIGADDESLGSYSEGSENINPKKVKGSKFSMVDSGDFKKGLFVKVHYRHLIISSSTSHLKDMLENESFETIDFFGLTEDSYRRFNESVIKPFILSWTKKQISEGLGK